MNGHLKHLSVAINTSPLSWSSFCRTSFPILTRSPFTDSELVSHLEGMAYNAEKCHIQWHVLDVMFAMVIGFWTVCFLILFFGTWPLHFWPGHYPWTICNPPATRNRPRRGKIFRERPKPVEWMTIGPVLDGLHSPDSKYLVHSNNLSWRLPTRWCSRTGKVHFSAFHDQRQTTWKHTICILCVDP